MAMTPEELKRLRELEAAATQGPWQSHNNHGVYYVSNGRDGLFATFDNRICEASTNFFGVDKTANMEFIAAAREALPKLLDEVERLEKQPYKVHCPACDCEYANDAGLDLILERDSLKTEMEIQVREKMTAIGEYGLMMLERDRALARVEKLRNELKEIVALDDTRLNGSETVDADIAREALAEDDKESE